MSNQVTLITTAPLSPYNANEVFTVSEKEAEMLLNPTVVDERGRTVKVDAKVVKYDPKNKDHKAALDAQRGKTADVASESGAVNAGQARQDVYNDLADEARPIAAERSEGDTGEQDQARVEAELVAKKKK